MKKGWIFLNIVLIVCSCLFFAISTILIKQSVKNNAEYYKYKDVAVSVPAIVSEVNVYDDSDNNKEYKTYIDYEYDGKTYSGIYWGTFSSKKTVGQQVVIKIIPDNPTHIFGDDIGAGDLNGATYMFCVVMNVLFFCVYETRKNKNEDSLKVVDANEVYAVTKPRMIFMMIFVSIAFARIILLYLYPSFVNYDNSSLSTFIVIIVSIVLVIHKLIECRSYSFNNYCLERKSCTDKDTSYDGEGNKEYNLCFGYQEFSCTVDLFHQTHIGDVFLLLLDKKKEILKVYDAKNSTYVLCVNDDELYRKKCMKSFSIRVIVSLIIAISFLAYFSVILHIMQ